MSVMNSSPSFSSPEDAPPWPAHLRSAEPTRDTIVPLDETPSPPVEREREPPREGLDPVLVAWGAALVAILALWTTSFALLGLYAVVRALLS